MIKIKLTIVMMSLFLLTGLIPAFAEDMAATGSGAMMEGTDHSAMMKGMDPSGMTEEQKAMQARMQEYMTPNENHEVLKLLVGIWKAHVTFWMDPKGEGMESDGTSEAKIIMDGRFLEESFHGMAMGQPFEGRGVYGYDNIRKE